MKTKTVLFCIFIILFPCYAIATLPDEKLEGKFISYYNVYWVRSTEVTLGAKDKGRKIPDAVKFMGAKVLWNWRESTTEYTCIVLKDLEFCILPEEEKDIKKVKDDPSQYEYEKEIIVDRYDKKGKIIGTKKSDSVQVKVGQIIIIKYNENAYTAMKPLKLRPIDHIQRPTFPPGMGTMIYEYRRWPKVIPQDKSSGDDSSPSNK